MFQHCLINSIWLEAIIHSLRLVPNRTIMTCLISLRDLAWVTIVLNRITKHLLTMLEIVTIHLVASILGVQVGRPCQIKLITKVDSILRVLAVCQWQVKPATSQENKIKIKSNLILTISTHLRVWMQAEMPTLAQAQIIMRKTIMISMIYSHDR